MRRLEVFKYTALALCLFVLICYVTLSTYFHRSAPAWSDRRQKAHALKNREIATKDAFRHAWNGYLQHAFPDDALKPLSQSFQTTRSSWGVTVVDGLSTAIMMDMPDIVDKMLEHIEKINFAETTAPVSLFGTAIRYLGGLLSAHDLLTYARKSMDLDGERADMLLRQTQTLVEALSFAYDTPSGIPQNNLRFSPKPVQKRTPVTDITAAGVPALEFFHFSKLTGSLASEAAVGALDYILNQSLPGTTPFPGLSGRYLDIQQGSFVDAEGGWYGGAGGFYEYLLKIYVLSPHRFRRCLDRWEMTADSSMTYLVSSPSSRPDLTFLSSYNGTEILHDTDHTAHFAAANFLLAGSILHEQKYIDFGLKLVDSQIEMYKSTATGLGPDQYAWLPQYCHDLHGYEDKVDPKNTRYTPKACEIPGEFKDQSSFYEKAGFYIPSSAYKLRPEVLESLYYAYRMTGDVKYQDASWEVFQRILEHTKIDSGGFAGLLDVNAIPDKAMAVTSAGEAGGMEDLQYSYMLAETILYAWLIQVGDDDAPWHIQADGKNTWIFNTEGHPLRTRESL